MAYQNPITNWLLDNKDKTHPVFTQFDWPERYLPEFFDFKTVIALEGIEAEGRGIATTPELAIEKASAEAVERYICKSLNISSVGVAVSGEFSAFNHAKAEAIERYCLFEHIRLGQILSAVPIELLAESKDLVRLTSQFKNRNIDSSLSFYRMNSPANSFGVVASITIEDDKCSIPIFGFSLADTFEKSCLHAFSEALPNFASLKDSLVSKIVSNSKAKDSTKELPWHLQKTFVSRLVPLLVSSRPPFNTESPFPLPKIEVEQLKIAHLKGLNGCPIDPIQVRIEQGPLRVLSIIDGALVKITDVLKLLKTRLILG